jgi:pimeloyl-ACP methyl ester carboxylesterase
LVFIAGFTSHCEHQWEEPALARSLERLASFSRLIWFDKRGTGLSDPVLDVNQFTLEQRMEDLRAVLDAVGSKRAAIFGASEGGAMSALFAATYPRRVSALVLYGSWACRRSCSPTSSTPPSTRCAWETAGGGTLVQAYHRLVRRELDRFRGQEANTAGDGFLATFDGPARAVRCAQAICEGVRRLGLEVRAGVHTGEIEVGLGDNIGGIAVHIGARIAALADGGEVLASRTVRDLVAGSGLDFEYRGTHHLKGVPEDWQIYKAIPGVERGRGPQPAPS